MIFEKEHLDIFEDYFDIKKEDFCSECDYEAELCERIKGYSQKIVSMLPNVKTEVSEMLELFSLIDELKRDRYLEAFLSWVAETKRHDFSMHPVHGLPHTFRCGFYAFCIGLKLGISEELLKICVLAGLFHDIGRTDDEFDVVHGEASASMLSRLFKELDEGRLSVMQAAVHTHCFPEPFDESMWLDYIHVLDIDDTRLVSDILRASDSLDYMRLGISGYDDKYLHSELERKMILVAFECNLIYNKFPEIYSKIFQKN